MDTRRAVGARGEDLAADHVTELGWTVLDRNWRSGRAGELDLVALEPGAGRYGTLVFCEVKARTGHGYGEPLEAITYAKLRRLQLLSLDWLAQHDVRCDGVRLDAIGVLLERGRAPQISHQRGVTR